jgi:hypothetical protein
MRQALELALEALEEAWYHVGTFQPTEKAIDLYDEARAAIKEALAQPEQEPKCGAIIEVFGKDWRLEYMSLPVGKHKLYTQQYIYTAPQPQMHPCAGRNCGSTNPNLHSAECFEDYEKATGMAQPEQEPVEWKLMPRDATDAMLKAMDECSTEGYDERLYAGHAASVYMAAWDEAPTPPQPERYITDAMKVRQAVAQALLDDVYAEELEQPEAKQSGTISITTPAPIAYLCENATGHKYFRWKKPSNVYKPIPLYTTPPQRKPLTDEQIAEMWLEILGSTPPSGIHEDGLQPWRFARAIEAAHGIKE